ncbi:MAG: phosphate transport system permease protein [Verrucomicrobiales bacterium]
MGGALLHSRPNHYGVYVTLWFVVPALGICVIGGLLDLILSSRDLGGIPSTIYLPLAFVIGLAGSAFAYFRIRPELRARNSVEKVIHWTLVGASMVSIVITFGIIASILFESIAFFSGDPKTDRAPVSIWEFLTGSKWYPSGSPPKFGALPLFAGTFMITLIAMIVAVPIGLFAAIFMAEYMPKGLRKWVKPILEILAGIPTVVYGFFAVVTVAPMVVEFSEWMTNDVLTPGTWLAGIFSAATHENALTCGLVMGIMVIPLISSLSDDVINSVPQSLREGSLALGTTRAETIRKVVLPAALPGIASAVLLAISRALGETMIVYMAAGLSPNLSANPLEGMTTVTVRMVSAITGDQGFDSAEPLSAFALGLVLFIVTFILNIGATIIVRRFRQRYEL